MFKKRVLILFFTLFSIYIYAETESDNKGVSLLENLYSSASDNIYIKGVIEDDNGNSKEITLYKKKNRDNFLDIAVVIDNDVYKNSSKEDREVYFKNDEQIDPNEGFYRSLPLQILNYGLRNRDLSLIESSTYNFKGLKPVKLIAVEKEKIVVLETLNNDELISNDDKDILLTKFNSESKSENVNILDSDDDKISPEEQSGNNNDESVINNQEELTEDLVDESSENSSEEEEAIINQEEEESAISEPTIDYEVAAFEKVVYQIDTESNIILKKEFYKGKDDRNPAFIVEVNSINFINEGYLATEFLISDVVSNRDYTLKYNPDSITYNKDRFIGIEKDLDNFYKVK